MVGIVEIGTKEAEKYRKLVDEGEVLSPEEAIARCVMILAKTDDPSLLTELSDEEIRLLSIIGTIADKTDNEVLSGFAERYMKLRVSLERKGRAEIINVAKGGSSVEEKIKKGLRSYFMGIGDK